ncbi:MAG: TIGR01777 family oxidoreductase [Thermoanaerobaculia bacterium]
MGAIDHVVVSGGTGLIGRALVKRHIADGTRCTVLSRRQDASLPAGARLAVWNAKTPGPWTRALDGATAVVHLAGENLASGRWTAARKRRLWNSRVDSTRLLAEVIRSADAPPPVYVQSSGVSYYGPRAVGEEVDEDAGPGDDFLSRLAIAWEEASRPLAEAGVRRVLLRTSPVLALDGGALPRMLTPFRLGLGAVLGDGRQAFPWIHLHDQVEAIRFLLADPAAAGPFNLAAPESVDNREFSKALARTLHRPCWFRVPGPMLRLLLGELADSLLRGQHVRPRRLTELGFEFRYPRLEPALRSLLGVGER